MTHEPDIERKVWAELEPLSDKQRAELIHHERQIKTTPGLTSGGYRAQMFDAYRSVLRTDHSLVKPVRRIRPHHFTRTDREKAAAGAHGLLIATATIVTIWWASGQSWWPFN